MKSQACDEKSEGRKVRFGKKSQIWETVRFGKMERKFRFGRKVRFRSKSIFFFFSRGKVRFGDLEEDWD